VSAISLDVFQRRPTHRIIYSCSLFSCFDYLYNFSINNKCYVPDWSPTNHCNTGYYWMAGYLPHRQRPYWNLTDGIQPLTYRNYEPDAYLAIIALTYKGVPAALKFNAFSNGQWMWEEPTSTHRHCFVCKLPEAIY